jgi:hypothetical protein
LFSHAIGGISQQPFISVFIQVHFSSFYAHSRFSNKKGQHVHCSTHYYQCCHFCINQPYGSEKAATPNHPGTQLQKRKADKKKKQPKSGRPLSV